MESWLLAQYAEIGAVKAEIESMKAANQLRIIKDETIAYAEDAFYDKAQELHGISNRIMENRFLEQEVKDGISS